ncbi:MAG: HAD hydrolase-like protein [Clostridia bacterium]|nr:HAD hydrolase-like protein [Clostridia bacterium]
MTKTANNIKYVLFDLDGTISDSYEGITKSVVYALEKMGITPPENREALRVFIGPSLWDSFMTHYHLDANDAERAVQYYREYYAPHGMLDCKLYDGVRGTLTELNALGKKLILATSKPEPAAVQILKHFGILDLFEFAAGASLDTSRTEKADVIKYALKSAHASADNSIMVGDRLYDVAGAHKIGMPCIGVLYGYGDREELEAVGADYIVSEIKDIVKIIANGK